MKVRRWRSHGEPIYIYEDLEPIHLWWMIPASVVAAIVVMAIVLTSLYWIVRIT